MIEKEVVSIDVTKILYALSHQPDHRFMLKLPSRLFGLKYRVKFLLQIVNTHLDLLKNFQL